MLPELQAVLPELMAETLQLSTGSRLAGAQEVLLAAQYRSHNFVFGV